jgi:mono/diheme cytochrome c family protein
MIVGVFISALIVVFLTGTIAAQDTPPPPYAGMENPFAWNDTSAQGAGKTVYTQSCAGCHGQTGANIPAVKFNDSAFGDHLQAQPDVEFWVLSEGNLSQGMPPFKSALSEDQRWQVLTYIRTLSQAQPSAPPSTANSGTVSLDVPDTGQAGQPLTMAATVQDTQGRLVEGETVEFFVSVDFFATGQIEIGQAVTDSDGVATLEYIPRVSGEMNFIARDESGEANGTISVSDANGKFYQAGAGIKLPALGQPILIGPDSATHIGEMGLAPTSAFYLPGGLTSWLLLVVAAVILVWFSYFRVIRQISHIPSEGDIVRDADTRLVPRLALAYVIILGTFLALKLLIGPYSHFNLLH